MVAIVGLASVAILLCILLLVRRSATRNGQNTEPHSVSGDPRSHGPRATGLN